MATQDVRNLIQSLEANGISDSAVLAAISQTPRDAFISDQELKSFAYADEALPIECGQTISQPFIVSYMTERLHIMEDNDVLEIGTGSGYQTAILARLAAHVYTIECHWPLYEKAVERFRGLGLRNITAICADGTRGWPERRSFDRIIVTAGAEEPPQALLDQLAPCGMMIIPLGPRSDQRITLITRSDGHDDYQHLLPVRFVPLLPRRG